MNKLQTIAATLGVFTIGALASAATTGFTDQATFSAWFKPSVEKMAFNNVITGYPDGSFGPQNNVNRAELAVMLDRFATAMGMPLQSEPTACTMQFVYGLTLNVQDMQGDPIDNAKITVAGLSGDDAEFTNQTGSGTYIGLGEQEGYFTFDVTKNGYTNHEETVKLEKDACHVIPQVRTVTLIKL